MDYEATKMDAPKVKGVQESEFEEFVNAFDIEILRMQENSEFIFNRVNLIKNIKEGQEVDRGIEEVSNPTGLLENLWHLLHKMKRVNMELDKSRQALCRFLG